MYNTSHIPIGLLLIGFITVWIISGRLYRSYRRKNSSIYISGTPILLAYYTDSTSIIPVSKGVIGDMHYSAMETMNFSPLDENSNSALIYRVELPFLANIHLLGISKKAGGAQLNPTLGKGVMEKVELEGSYSDYFALYCEKGMQNNTRYFLNPKAMLFTIDFCQSQNWEIVGNQLYFISASDMKSEPNNPADLQDDIIKFVTSIRPVLESPLTDEEKAAETPYGEDRRTNLNCPICKSTMLNQDSYFSCPKGDGILIEGSQFLKIRKNLIRLPDNNSLVHKDGAVLNCPSCGNVMSKVAYDSGSTIIDSCTHCPYRWLDTGDYEPIHDII